MNTTTFKALTSVAKLGLAGGVIFGIAGLILTQNPETATVGPRPAKADIGDFLSGHGSESAKFTEAMVALGLEPRVYDYNGNVMYFASGYAPNKRPTEILRTVQEHLVEYGVNAENHSDVVPMQRAAKSVDWGTVETWDDEIEQLGPASSAVLNGDVVPTQVSENQIQMVGMEFDQNFDEATELYRDENGEIRPAKIKHMMAGYKYVDAAWEPQMKRSTITAVWSGENFKAGRMDGTSDDQSAPDPAVPSCMGCDRDFRFQSLNTNEPFQSNMWTSNLQVQRTYDFYKGTMEARGWTETGAQPYLDRIGEIIPQVDQMGGKLLNLEKGDESIQLAIVADPAGGTNVITLHQTDGAQLVQPKQ